MKIFNTLIILILISSYNLFASTKTAIISGNWNNDLCWSPAGQPLMNDDVIIPAGKEIKINTINAICNSITIENSASLEVTINNKLTIDGIQGLNIDGKLDINGDVSISKFGTSLILGNSSKLNWNPTTNSIATSTLFTNCNETINPTSTIIINKWFDKNVGFGKYINGDIGNLTISNIPKWNMMNTLQEHQVKGKLKIEKSYIILDSTNLISNINIGSIELTDINSILDIYRGDHIQNFTLTTNDIKISAGQLNIQNKNGKGNAVVNILNNLNITNQGIFTGTYGHDGNIDISIGNDLNLNQSMFYGCYSGNGNFKLNVNNDLNVIKSGAMCSEFHGIYNGIGNVDITIGHNFIQQGYVDLILNDGINGVGTGNANLNINNNFIQTSGDFRSIYNLTSYNSGSTILKCKNIDFSGGIFMLYYACSNISKSNKLEVENELKINFTSSQDVFRGNGLSNLNGTHSLSKLQLLVNGKITLEGNSRCELLTNATYGDETTNTNGKLELNGPTLNFNYTNHNTQWNHNGSINVFNGKLNFALNSGDNIANITGDLIIIGGQINLKNNNGNTSIKLEGNYFQSGGSLYFYNNLNNPLQGNVAFNIKGNFEQQGGIIDFNNNALSNGQTTMNVSSKEYLLNGGIMKCGDVTNSSYFGNINFENNTISFKRNPLHSLQQIKQAIKPNTTLELVEGNLQVASSFQKEFDFLIINNSALLKLNTFQIESNLSGLYSGLLVKEDGEVSTSKAEGFYNQDGTAAIKYHLGFDYSLSTKSIITYEGSTKQIVTGFNETTNNNENHSYGILKINKQSNSKESNCYLNNNEVIIRNQLRIINGELAIDNYHLTLSNGNSDAFQRLAGYLNPGEKSNLESGYINWKNIQNGNHTIYFGINENSILPLTFNCKQGFGNTISITTSNTNKNNEPFPIINGNQTIQILEDLAKTQLIDRLWYFKGENVIADLSVSYNGIENTTNYINDDDNFSIQTWDQNKWGNLIGNGDGTTNGIGKIEISDFKALGPIILSYNGKVPDVRFNDFNAILTNKIVALSWNTLKEKNSKEFIIERSANNQLFEVIKTIPAHGNSSQILSYTASDQNPIIGNSYYRIKSISSNGTYYYTPSKLIMMDTENSNISIDVYPNPFTDNFSAKYELENNGNTNIKIINAKGEIVYSTQRNDDVGNNLFTYSNSNRLPPGTYFLDVISGTKRVTKKIIKSIY